MQQGGRLSAAFAGGGRVAVGPVASPPRAGETVALSGRSALLRGKAYRAGHVQSGRRNRILLVFMGLPNSITATKFNTEWNPDVLRVKAEPVHAHHRKVVIYITASLMRKNRSLPDVEGK